jgi:hypothetical protein
MSSGGKVGVTGVRSSLKDPERLSSEEELGAAGEKMKLDLTILNILITF